jgi:transposase
MAVDWIEGNCDLLSRCPANARELNPIESLWAILKHSVAALELTTIAELEEVLSRVGRNPDGGD